MGAAKQMKALLQRVSRAKVSVEGKVVGEIEAGLLVFLGVDKVDTPLIAEKLLQKVLSYRIFADDMGKMNLGLKQTQGGLLVISQFTLSAETNKGLRPGFSLAAEPVKGELLYNHFLNYANHNHPRVASGQFGANMQVELINDGPVTFLLESK